MKRIAILLIIIISYSCNDLNLSPLSEGSSENWYSTPEEIEMAVTELFNIDYWDAELTRISSGNAGYSLEWTDRFTDDWTARTTTSAVDGGTLTSQTNFVNWTWNNAYKCIAAANRILLNLDKASSNITEGKLNEFAANAKFARAGQYSKLIFHYGDVPYYTNLLTIEEAFSLGQTSKETILDSIYADYDYAIKYLPEVYGSNEYQFATKGAALAMKARIALYTGDYRTAMETAKLCIDLEIYSLHPNYRELFLSSTKNSAETIFGNPRSTELGVMIPKGGRSKEPLSRLAGGFANGGPSWDLLCAYLCTDGLPVDESPLFDPHKPFRNRDPRCTASIVEFGTEWLGYIYQPHPDSLTTLKTSTGEYVSNADNRAILMYSSFNGLVWKKKIDQDWLDLETDPDNIVIRYADVLLMYAEAKIELGDIDQSVLDAINKVRARAYGVHFAETNLYPAITTTNQAELRKFLRIERRMEFAFEGRRYSDLIRWRLAEKALTKNRYGLLDPDDLRENLVNTGGWFFPETPEIDEDGLPDFTSMYDKGLIKLLAVLSFDASKQYLWPIPSSEIEINKNLTQNPGY
ncbi:RagB/SusD family nutrient uptake outer membrane protein [Sunxiuqinia rutila]|uniref:RagB/SusD family nutrient uptake outer membrane protein n=1 Tax=Sunxiuqinia rutila TaxID=1397841 RepID=UPI003D35E847